MAELSIDDVAKAAGVHRVDGLPRLLPPGGGQGGDPGA